MDINPRLQLCTQPFPLSSRQVRIISRHRLRVRQGICKVTSRPRARNVGIVNRRRATDGLGSAAEHVAQTVRETLQSVGWRDIRLDGVVAGLELRVSEYLISKDVIVGWAGCAFDGIVRLKEEVPIARFGDYTVHNEASLLVAVFGDMRVFRRREEAGMMAFANHDKSETRLRSAAVVVVQIITSFSHRCQFLIKDLLVLAFRNPVAVNEDVLRQGTVFALPSIKT